jgi:DNA-binding MarR family transcriptional regulator
MYRLLRDLDGEPLFSTFFKALQDFRETYFSNNALLKLSKTEIEILTYMAKKNTNFTAKELSEYMSVSKALISRSIDHLVKEGYLTKEKDPKDKRWHILALGEKSKPYEDALLMLQNDFYDVITKDIKEDEIRALAATIQTMTKNVQEAIATKK